MARQAASAVEDAFLQAVLEHPDDDTPRLIFADWLEERSDPRGTFIRFQCERAHLTVHDSRFKEILAQESALFRQFEPDWSKPVLRFADEVEYRRGFIEHVNLPAQKFLKNAARLFRAAPVRSVKLTHVGAYIRQLADCAQMAKVRALNLSQNGMGLGSRGLQTLVDSPLLAGLTEVRLFDCALGPPSADVLARAPHLANLRTLELGRNAIGPEGAEALARSQYLTKLRSLGLYLNSASTGGAISLSRTSTLRLTHLDLGFNDIGNEGINALVNCPAFRELAWLAVPGNAISNLGLEAIARSPAMGQLVHLSLEGNRINDRGLQSLAGSALLSRLRHLNLENNEFGQVGAKALAESANLSKSCNLLLGRTRK